MGWELNWYFDGCFGGNLRICSISVWWRVVLIYLWVGVLCDCESMEGGLSILVVGIFLCRVLFCGLCDWVWWMVFSVVLYFECI